MNTRPNLLTCCLTAIVLISVSSRCQVLAQSATKDQETLALLQAFAAKTPPQNDEDALQALRELSKQIPDSQLPIVEKYGLSDDAKDLQFPFALLLIERSSYDPAARLIVNRLGKQVKHRQYTMWNWWGSHFGKREDSKELTRRITESFLREFDKGDAKTKLVVAQVFGKGETESKMTLEDFKKSIAYSEQSAPAKP